jgi:hypothetical protein
MRNEISGSVAKWWWIQSHNNAQQFSVHKKLETGSSFNK